MRSIKSFLYIAKVFGLIPFSLSSDEKQKCAFFPKFLHRLPTLLMLIFYVLCVSSILWRHKTASEISNTANWIQFVPNSVIFFIVLITADRSRDKIQLVGRFFDELDQKLLPLMVCSKATQGNIRTTSFFASTIVIFCSALIASLHYIIGVNSLDLVSKFYWMAFVLAKVGLLTFNFMFALYMAVLLERLIIVKKTIKWITDISVENVMVAKGLNNQVQKLNILTTITIPNNTVSEIFDDLYEVVELVQRICSKMNSYFGRKVIFTVLSAFICLTVQLFYFINNIRNGFQSTKAVWAAVASCSLIFTHILELWVIFISGHRVKDMWNSLINRIQGLRRRFSSDEVFKAKIDELISIMVFTKVEMRAAGFFNIDLSVITSIVSSIATYLVVLLQFKLSEDENLTNSTSHGDVSQYNLGPGPVMPSSSLNKKI